MDDWLADWKETLEWSVDAMKLTALVGQVDVKSDRDRWQRHTHRESKRDTLRRMKQIHNSANIRGLLGLFRGQKKLLIAQMVMVIKKNKKNTWPS